MTDWTAEHEARASGEGWRIVPTIDNGERHVYYTIAGTRFTDNEARGFVLTRAREGSNFHQGVLQLMLASRIKRPKRKNNPD